MIYLDGAATYPLLPCVKEAMQTVMAKTYGNASALHSAGRAANLLLEEARISIARLINAQPEEIIFTSGGSEANNTIVRTFADQNIYVSAIEHPSVLEPAKLLAKKLTILPVNKDGTIKPFKLDSSSKTLISVMLANNEIGTIEPLEKLFQKKPENFFFHSDLTQAIGKINIDVKKLNLDYATISAHKFGGPIGIGALYIKSGSPISPLILGGHQEKNLRAGTYPTINLAGFKAAADFTIENDTPSKYKTKILPLRDELAARILKEIPYSSVNTPLKNSLPNILNVSFAAAEGESIQLYLDAEGIAVSTGSACASGDGEPSHVLMATHHDAEIAHSSIRFSLTLNTAKSDIDKVMQILPTIIKNLQSISTINPKGKND